jgi:hypothetical protein
LLAGRGAVSAANKRFRLTLNELHAIMCAVFMATAGELDGDEWTDELTDALHVGEAKLQHEYNRRVRLVEAKLLKAGRER